MKKFPFMTILAVVALSFAAGGIAYRTCAGDTTPSDDPMAWLQAEFGLGAPELKRIQKMHTEYAGLCEEHCRTIREARAEVRRLETEGSAATEVEKARAHARQVDLQCKESLRTHLHAVAEVMGREKGGRYLAIVLPHLSNFDHEGAPDLKMNATSADHSHVH